jgi:hypothetical protein
MSLELEKEQSDAENRNRVAMAEDARNASIAALAQSYLDRRDEDWTWVDPEDIKRLARAVLGRD